MRFSAKQLWTALRAVAVFAVTAAVVMSNNQLRHSVQGTSSSATTATVSSMGVARAIAAAITTI